MACSTVTTSGGSLLYAFDLYEVDFSSLWTLIPDVPDINFPLITFSNTIDGTIPVNGAETGQTLESVFYPSFPNNMQLIEPDLSAYNAKILHQTPATLSYLLSGLSNVFASTGDISNTITYSIDMVVSASQDPAEELEKAWDEAWERGLINPTASILYSYFNLMGLTYTMDIRRSEGENLPAFTTWLETEGVPEDIQDNLLALNAELMANGPEDWNTEYNYSNEGFTPYQITSVFFGIQNLEKDPKWTCENPYDLPIPWTKYKDFARPRLDSLRAYGRLIIPDKITKVRSGTYEITAASISGSGVATIDVPYGFDLTDLIQSPYGSAFTPSPQTVNTTGNWSIETLVSNDLWEFDNTHFGVTAAYDTYFTMQIKVPLSLRSRLKADPTLGSEIIAINWSGEFIARTSSIFTTLSSLYFSPLYSSCENGNTDKVKYIPGIGIIFDVQSYANGDVTLQTNLVNCKNTILSLYDNYYEYAGNYSVAAEYGDILNIHGRYIDTHGSEFFATSKQVLRPQEYIQGDNEAVEIINLNAIVEADEAKECANGQLYNADDLNTCPDNSTNIFQTNQVPIQNSSTSISLSSKLTKVNGKICPVLPPNISLKK
jgi:hypothetical protein